MKFAPPFAHVAAVELQLGAAGTNHCVSQTRSVSLSGEAGAAVLRSAIDIVTCTQAVLAGWQGFVVVDFLAVIGQLTFDERMSRFAIDALVWPGASYVASPAGSVAELRRIESPLICWPA